MMNANHAMTFATVSSVSPWRNEAILWFHVVSIGLEQKLTVTVKEITTVV